MRMREDVVELTYFESVISIAGDPSLQQTIFNAASGAATIREVLHHMADLGDMEMCGNEAAIRQCEGEKFIGVLGKMGFEFLNVYSVKALVIWKLFSSHSNQSHGFKKTGSRVV